MPSWRTVGTLTAIGAGAGTLLLTCPEEDTFDKFFDEFYKDQLWPIIKNEINAKENANSKQESNNKLLNWLKKTADKATNVFEKEVLFAMLFPSDATFELYHLFRIAKIKMYTNEFPNGFDLIFIGAAGSWHLNPVQSIMLKQLCGNQNL